MKRPLNELPDGTCLGKTYKQTCRVCGVAFTDSAYPTDDYEPICHACYFGSRRGPTTIFPSTDETLEYD